MNRIALAAACVGFGSAYVATGFGTGCGGGTLGTPGAGNSPGTVTTGSPRDGVAGASFPTGIGGAAGSPGIGGDGAPVPGTGGIGGSGNTGGYGGVVGPMGRGGFVGTGRGGTGGSGLISCPPPPPPVCGGLCGNGVLDTCWGAIAPQCLPITQTEQCDGLQLGGDSCLQRGWASGNLTCLSDCTVDESACSQCSDLGGPLVSCGPAPVAFPYVGAFSMAATDSEVGLAQIDYNIDIGTSRLTFARLDAGLAVINVVGLEDTLQPGPLQGSTIDSAVAAPLGSGWAIAGCASGQLFLHALDAKGKKAARTTITDGTDYRQQCAGGALSLAPGADGRALLTFQTFYGAFQYLFIGADGLPVGTPAALVDPSTPYIGLPSVAWTGDAFTIALPVQAITQGIYANVVRLLQVNADGTLTTIGDILKGEFYEAPVVVSGAGDIRLVYVGSEPGRPFQGSAIVWRQIGKMGQSLTGAVTLGTAALYVDPTRATAFGSDTIVMLNNAYQDELTLADVGGTGALSYITVARSPTNDIYMYDMVRRGPEVVVGWIHGQGALTLARVTP